MFLKLGKPISPNIAGQQIVRKKRTMEQTKSIITNTFLFVP